MVSTQNARMHRFIGGLGDHLIGSCTIAALNRDMDIARLMGDARAYSSRGPPRQAQSLDRSTASAPAQLSRPRQCGRSHLGECRYGSTACYGFRVEGHKIRDCPKLRVEGRGDRPQYTSTAGSSSALMPSSSRGTQPPVGRGTGRGRGSSSGACPN
ncbi:uncharacterized protein LOC125838466 [Solanum verrucosum]|uniref:uncharacterized protein LOC125838466 n=1 Tax=Solanum verrucosum TaxID=315347 RepID=UPI0020D0A6C1|nr:uncharacterized protein LOC125838466 [Solanum verrucosum]